MKKMSQEISQDELTSKTLRRIYNRGKRKGYVSPEYIEKTIKNKNIPREKIEEILVVFKNEDIKVIDEAQAALMPVVKKKRGRKKGSTNKKTPKSLANGSDDQEATLKRIRKKGNTIALEAANRNYGTKIYAANRIKIQGKLVSLYRNFH